MGIKDNNVKNFFDGYADDFDSIYGYNPKRSVIDKMADKLFRGAMYARYKETLKTINDDDFHSILDIGCGSGRYCVEYLKLSKSVTGIDLSQKMIELSKKITKYNFPEREVSLIQGDYLKHKFSGKFDAAVLMGFFDYIEDANIVFSKLKSDVNKIILASIPKQNHFLARQRKVRYKIRNCPLYLYTYNDLIVLMKNNNFDNYDIIDFGRELFVKVII